MQSGQNVDEQFSEEKVSSWSASEKRFLGEHYCTVPIRNIVATLGRGVSASLSVVLCNCPPIKGDKKKRSEAQPIKG